MGMDYSLYQKIIDGTGRILDTDMTTPNVGKYVTEQQLADWINGQAVVMGYLYNGVFYSDAGHTSPLTGKGTAIYIDKTGPNDAIYRWDGAAYVPLTEEAQVQAVITALQNGTLVPLKAIQDQNGNVIVTTYATKTELSAEATARTNADSNLQQQINQHDSRLSNLEQKAGDYVPVQYRGTNAVPTGKASYGLVEKIVGKTRAWNQLLKKTDFTFSGTYNTVTFTPDTTDGSIGINGTASAGIVEAIIGGILTESSHKYLIYDVNRTSGVKIYNGYSSNGVADCAVGGFVGPISGGNWTDTLFIDIASGAQFNNNKCKVRVYDLTLMGIDNVTTVSEALALIPSLALDNPYDAGSLVSTTVEGVEAVGVNIWDEQWESGIYDLSTGEKEPYGACIRCKNLIPVKPSTQYYWKNSASDVIRWVFLDKNLNVVDNLGTDAYALVFTTKPNACYMAFYYTATTYNNTLQICLNSLPDAIKNTYHPYKESSIAFPSDIELRGIGDCIETYDPETGVLDDGKFGLLDLGDATYFPTTINGVPCYFIEVDGGYKDENFEAVISAYFTKMNTDNDISTNNMSYRTYGTLLYGGFSRAVFHNDSWTDSASAKSFMDGVMLLYRKATYTPSSPVSPIHDNTIYTEGGGTINTIQTQTPVIDNCLDVGYLAL